MSSAGLKPCPFCGGEAQLWCVENHRDACWDATVECTRPYCNAKITAVTPLLKMEKRNAEDIARNKWNMRTA